MQRRPEPATKTLAGFVSGGILSNMPMPDHLHDAGTGVAAAEQRLDTRCPAEAKDPLSDGERAYLTLLFNKYRGPLHRYLSRVVRSSDDVAELVQETYFRVMRHAGTMRFEAVARAYLFQTAANLMREYYRRRTVRHADQHLPLDEIEALRDEDAPERLALRDEALSCLRSAIEKMPRDLRDVFVLSRFRQQTYPEIASALGVSTRTVERRMHQALEFLVARTRGFL